MDKLFPFRFVVHILLCYKITIKNNWNTFSNSFVPSIVEGQFLFKAFISVVLNRHLAATCYDVKDILRLMEL